MQLQMLQFVFLSQLIVPVFELHDHVLMKSSFGV